MATVGFFSTRSGSCDQHTAHLHMHTTSERDNVSATDLLWCEAYLIDQSGVTLELARQSLWHNTRTSHVISNDIISPPVALEYSALLHKPWRIASWLLWNHIISHYIIT